MAGSMGYRGEVESENSLLRRIPSSVGKDRTQGGVPSGRLPVGRKSLCTGIGNPPCNSVRGPPGLDNFILGRGP